VSSHPCFFQKNNYFFYPRVVGVLYEVKGKPCVKTVRPSVRSYALNPPAATKYFGRFSLKSGSRSCKKICRTFRSILENRFSEIHILLKGGRVMKFCNIFLQFFFSAQLGENSMDEINTKFSSAVTSCVKIGVRKFTSCSFTLPNLT
jgi:hypothetical protein